MPVKTPQITILYEDKDILAIDKPAGLVVHPDGKTEEVTLTDWVLEHYPKTAKVGEPIVIEARPATEKSPASPEFIINRPGIVHRLDRETSGVMLIAKTAKAHAHLKEQFKERMIQKKYYAFLNGELKEQWGIINRPIGRSTSDFRKWSATRGARGELRPAETWWTLLGARGGYSFVEAEPKTGRTHQIRVHFKAINHPVVCDRLYAPDKLCAFGFGRTALHASSITFTDMKGEAITVTAPIPVDFKEAMIEAGIEIPAKVAKK